MSGFVLQVSPGDALIMSEVVKKQLSNGSAFVGSFSSVGELEQLETLISENSRVVLLDQTIRKYAELMPEMIELKAQ